MSKVLTVVVPSYNVEDYIEKNLDSLCEEDLLDDLEIIVVDDGSTDRTGEIANCYQIMYPEAVSVVHKENGGHGSGINCGIRQAAGDYFKVVDADDWVDADALRKLIHFLKTTEADAVISGFYWAYDDGSGDESRFRKKPEMIRPFKAVSYGKKYLFDEVADKIYVKMHALTIRTEILRKNHISLDENCFYVDTEYILYPVPHIRTISFTEDFVYQYRIGRSGQSVSPEKMRALQTHYDKVLKSLLIFYDTCASGKVSCSLEKRSYIAGVIARVVAGRVKIFLSFPPGYGKKQELMKFDCYLQKRYPEIYMANQNRPVRFLRISRYALYKPASVALHLRNRRN